MLGGYPYFDIRQDQYHQQKQVQEFLFVQLSDKSTQSDE